MTTTEGETKIEVSLPDGLVASVHDALDDLPPDRFESDDEWSGAVFEALLLWLDRPEGWQISDLYNTPAPPAQPSLVSEIQLIPAQPGFEVLQIYPLGAWRTETYITRHPVLAWWVCGSNDTVIPITPDDQTNDYLKTGQGQDARFVLSYPNGQVREIWEADITYDSLEYFLLTIEEPNKLLA